MMLKEIRENHREAPMPATPSPSATLLSWPEESETKESQTEGSENAWRWLGQMYATIHEQQKTITRQQHFIQKQQNENQKLRALVWRLKRTNRILKKERKEIAVSKNMRELPEIKCVLK